MDFGICTGSWNQSKMDTKEWLYETTIAQRIEVVVVGSMLQ
jgi:hypothetical protein